MAAAVAPRDAAGRPTRDIVRSVGGDTLDAHDPRWSLERRVVKWVLHQVTGKCEVQRILDGEAWHSVRMSRALSKSLQLSKQLKNVHETIYVEVNAGFSIDSVTTNVIDLKMIESEAARLRHLRMCLVDLRKANTFLTELERSRHVKFDASEPSHADLLERLWKGLLPGEKAPVKTDWKRVGFQGADPSSDFRGMGLLGLEALAHFVERNQDAARLIMNLYEELGFAITGINLAGFTLRMFETRQLDHIFFAAPESLHKPKPNSSAKETANLLEGYDDGSDAAAADDVRKDLHDRAVAIFAEQFGHYVREFFSRQWRTSDRNIMHFGIHLATFEARVRSRLFRN
ncbi:ELMO domain-containing protein 2 [Hondaea fermentalgiana]|uniref:ELMO domain-containing protein 2 n=1 Tax=Hondaea fermentalgiana TaxID=2315210 RepID=A0A2R5GZ16_9STRA|nr:ELMO domain-containing protein 2 [Hondaea fermentalgiana]|eukprot:GBG33993.1 ELMO domain-containing protein 2 [Hondaea fermentalgiana]